MQCTQAGELMQLSLDRRLSPGMAGLLDAHIRQCAACRAEYMRLRQVARLLEALPEQHASPGFTSRVLAGISAARRHPLKRYYPALNPGMIAGISAVVLCALVLFVIGLLQVNAIAVLTGSFVAWHYTVPGLVASPALTFGDGAGIEGLFVNEAGTGDGWTLVTLIGCGVLVVSLGILRYLLRPNTGKQPVQAGR